MHPPLDGGIQQRELIVIADKSRLARLEKKSAVKREERRRKALEEGGLMPLNRTKLEGV